MIKEEIDMRRVLGENLDEVVAELRKISNNMAILAFSYSRDPVFKEIYVKATKLLDDAEELRDIITKGRIKLR